MTSVKTDETRGKVPGAAGWYYRTEQPGIFYRDFGALRLVVKRVFMAFGAGLYTGSFAAGVGPDFDLTRPDLEAATGEDWTTELSVRVALNDIGRRARDTIRGWAK